jgi:anti-sigma-K factor RskA
MSEQMSHELVDELAAALALGAMDADEAQAVVEHLIACPEPHEEARSVLGAQLAVALSLAPVEPSQELRDRLMQTVERTPQPWLTASPSPTPAMTPAAAPERPASARGGWRDWLLPRLMVPLAGVAAAAVIALGALNLGLQSQLADRDRALRAVADAITSGQAAFRVEGADGRGYVVDTAGSGSTLVVADLSNLPADKLYELWLLDAKGTPVAVGTFRPSATEPAVVHIEKDLTGYTTFAVTVETHRVDSPTLPNGLDSLVMVGTIGS